MNCPRCQTANPDGAKFCLNCGNALTGACPNCGTPLAPGAKFCYNCGYRLAEPQAEVQAPLQRYIPKELFAKLQAARASRSMQGERRIVTVLFCDVKGSTTLAEQLDPEEWAEIMNGAFEYLIKPVYRYEGTLARLMGDAILAFFGAPIAHEDDPQRAVLAGLEMIEGVRTYREQLKRQRGLDFDVRVGINTGLVVVGEVGSDLRVEYTAMGDAVNLAARMEQTAVPGTVQISGNTYRLVAPLFELDPLGGIEVKGRREPVPAYRVIRPRARPGRLRGIEGLEAPLIGREHQMMMLERAIANLRQGQGQIVSVIGAAGLGKSRLVAELRQSLVAKGLVSAAKAATGQGMSSPIHSRIGWYEGRSFSYQSSTPYAPFVDLFGNLFSLYVEETDAEKYNKVKAQVAEILPERVTEIAPFIATLLGIQLSGEDLERVGYLEPPQLRGRIFQATRDFFERLAGMQPLVLVMEDLHWIDPTSLDLLEDLLPLTDRAALMIIALFRPRRQEPSWRFHEIAERDYPHRYTSIVLDPLDENCSRTLVANLLHIEDLPEKVRALILKKAEGNPFFVEEVIRSLLDAKLVVRENSHWRATREIENIAVPDTLAGVITARLDRLDEESKRVAQTASVVGREFQFDALVDVHEVIGAQPAVSVLDEALARLQRRELIREKSRVPQRVYLFKHVLTQETAYASILLSRRRELHRRVAECLERIAPEYVNDIARHFLEAKEDRRALPYVLEAGDRAARAYATPEAIGFYTKALEILQTVDDPVLARRAYEGLGGALMLANEIQRAVDNYQAMLHYAEAHGDVPMKVSALNKLGQAAMWLGQFQELEMHLTASERLAREHQDLAGLAELCTIRCGVYNLAGNFNGAEKYLSESVQIGRKLNQKEQMAFGLTHIALTMTYMTRFDEAWQIAQEAWQISEELGDRQHLAELLTFPMPLYHLRNGDLDAARQAAEEGTKLSARIGAAFTECLGAYMLGTIAQLRGEYEPAVGFHQRALQAGRASGFPFLVVIALGVVGTAYLEISEKLTDQAAELHMQALKMLEHPAGAPAGGTAWADLGFSVLAQGELDRADEFFQKGLTVPTTQRLLQRPLFLIGSAFVALARNNLDEATKLVSEARQYAEERAMKYLYPSIAIAEGRVRAVRGEPERALQQFTRAEELALEMQMRPFVWQARAGAAQVLATLGRESQAETKRRQAHAMIDEIANLFEDEQLRSMFIESAMRKIS